MEADLGPIAAEPKASAGVVVQKLSATGDLDKWEMFVAASPQANPFATTQWSQAIKKTLGLDTDIWVALKGQEWLAGIPVFNKQRFGRRACVSVPLSAYSSVLYSPVLSKASHPAKVTSNHLEATKPLISVLQRQYSTAQNNLLPSIGDVRAWQWSGWDVRPAFTYVIDLTEELKPAHSVRKHVKKCEAAGFEISNDWDLDACWGVMRSTISRQANGIGMSEREFKSLAGMLRDVEIAWMMSVRTRDGETLASRIELAIPGTRTAYDWVAGSRAEKLSTGATPWLMTKIAERCREDGFTHWNLCGAQIETVARFKGELGGSLVNGFLVESPSTFPEWLYQSGRKVASRLFRRLPIRVRSVLRN